jgi:hypothetical protein
LLVVLLQYSTLVLQEKELEPLLWLCKVSSVLCIAEGLRKPAPFFHAQVLRCAWMLILVLSEVVVAPALLLLLPPALWFLVAPHPWLARGVFFFFGHEAPLQFGWLSLVLKAQVVAPRCLGSDHLASYFSLVLWGLDQKLMILAWVTLGLFL